MAYRRISKYYPGCDGTRLALDVYLPEGTEKVPALLTAGYGDRRGRFQREGEALERFLQAGYAVAVMEMRGAGASFGHSDGFFGPADGRDLACVIEQLAAEPWCSGRIGMFGGSNYGMSQEMALIRQPEALRAVIPCDCSSDFYDQDYPNGVSAIPEFHGDPNAGERPHAAPVDDDPDGSLRDQAEADHARNLPFLAQHRPNMYRDDVHPLLGYRPSLDVPAWEHMEDIRFGHVHVYGYAAWFDPGATNRILSYKYWGGRLMVGPWMHVGAMAGNSPWPEGKIDWAADHLRFFDRWLKDAPSDLDAEPPIRYYTLDAGEHPWRCEADFPVAGTEFARLYFTRDGGMGETCPETGRVDYTVRDDINIYDPWGRMNRDVRKDMREEDAKSLTFTSEPLPGDLELTGVPVIELFATSTHADGDFIAVLEAVAPDGGSRFLAEGVIRAAHAKTQPNPAYDALGLPYHRGYREDKAALDPDKPLKLAFHLEALSRVIPKGSCLRVAISCGGSGYQQPEGFPEKMPVVSLYTGGDCASSVLLPAIRPTATEFHGADGSALYAFKRAVYLERDGHFACWPCRQVYPDGADVLKYETDAFTLVVRTEGRRATAETQSAALTFSGVAELPERYVFPSAEPEIPLARLGFANYPDADRKNLYVATVPVRKGVKGNMNIRMRSTFDIFIDLIYPQGVERKDLPCIVNVHGFGGNHHCFESNAALLLEKGCTVASIDYRFTPPDTWRESSEDARGCIRYLKAHSAELGLDPQRFGLIGGSMGGYLTALLAADNGDPAFEGTVGGNTEFDSSLRAAAAYFAPTDFFHFAEDTADMWPGEPLRVAAADAGVSPNASFIGHLGQGKGMGDVKRHLHDETEPYPSLRREAELASPVCHVTKDSAPLCLVHGMFFDCGIQVPLGQSLRMFEAYSRKGAKALLLCNNNCMYGEDPEVKRAVVEFLTSRV